MIIRRKTLGYKELPISQELIERYKAPGNMLRHARFIPGKTQGIFLIDKGDRPVGYIAWEGDTVTALEVFPEYRKKGIGTWLLEKSGCTELTVSKKNQRATDLYKSLGWEIYKETPKIYFMKSDV